MEFDAYRDWKVVKRVFCLSCQEREVNGPGAEFCARCEAWLNDVIAEMEAQWRS